MRAKDSGWDFAIVRELVELHGGTIRAESGGPGTRAVFTVTLPLSEVITTHAPTENTFAIDTNRLRDIRISRHSTARSIRDSMPTWRSL